MEVHSSVYHNCTPPSGFRTAVSNRVEYEGAEKNPDDVTRIMNRLKTEC